MIALWGGHTGPRAREGGHTAAGLAATSANGLLTRKSPDRQGEQENLGEKNAYL
jgi:hypothetical protein